MFDLKQHKKFRLVVQQLAGERLWEAANIDRLFYDFTTFFMKISENTQMILENIFSTYISKSIIVNRNEVFRWIK